MWNWDRFYWNFENRPLLVIAAKIATMLFVVACAVICIRDHMHRVSLKAPGLQRLGLLLLSLGLCGWIFYLDDLLRGETRYYWMRYTFWGSCVNEVPITRRAQPVKFWFHCLVNILFSSAVLAAGVLFMMGYPPGALIGGSE